MANRTTLKDFFKTNAIPKASDFADLINASLNQDEDSIRKQGTNPIALEAQGSDKSSDKGPQDILHFYKKFSEKDAQWKIGLNAQVDANTYVPGFNLCETAGQSRFFIKENNGSIGMGTTNPQAKLHIRDGNVIIDNGGKLSIGTSTPNLEYYLHSYGTAPRHVLLQSSSGSGTWLDIKNDSAGGSVWDLISTGKDNGDGAGKLLLRCDTSQITAITCLQNGNVGIGTAIANAPLQFASAVATRKIVLFETANNDHQFLGFGINPGMMRYQVAVSTDDHVFFSGKDATSSTELMRIKGDGRVVIGGATVNARLQFASVNANRKIVLYEVANNDHQFLGLGINGSLLRYQVAATGNDHVFFSGTDADHSSELMRIKGTGNVGIGANNPQVRLHVSGTDFHNTLLESSSGTGTWLDIKNTSENGVKWSLISTGKDNGEGVGKLMLYCEPTSTVAITCQKNGSVGIGTATANAPLQFASAIATRKIVLYETANNDNQFLGFGINPGMMRYQVAVSTDDHVFHSGKDATNSTELMRVKGNGRVGIGTDNPQAKLHVEGGVNCDTYQGSSTYLHKSAGSNIGNMISNMGNYIGFATFPLDNVSILASGRIVGLEVHVTSDERIKKDFIINDSLRSLEKVKAIGIKDFLYKDTFQHGSAVQKGVVAQELEGVLPEAVSRHTDFVPDIYALPDAAVVKDAVLSLTMPQPHNLQTGDSVRLITAAGVQECIITKKDDITFTVGNWREEATDIFVYGKKVKDFRTVNYNSIFCLGISAIQELCKQVEHLKEDISNIKNRLAASFVSAR